MENKRILLLAAVFGSLLIANAFVHFGGGGLDQGLFTENNNSIGQVSGKARRAVQEIETLPELSFQFERPGSGEPSPRSRNPFLFGIDRRAEREQRERLAEVEAARQRVEEMRSLAVEQVVEDPDPVPQFPGQLLAIIEDAGTGIKQVAVSLDQEIFVLSEGAVAGGRYRLRGISYQVVEIEDLEHGDIIRVPVEERQ